MSGKKGKYWESLLQASIFFLLYELAAESSFYLLELSLAALALCFLWEERAAVRHPIRMIGEGVALTKPLGKIWIMCVLYLGWELVTVSFSPAPEGVWEKYKVVALMLFLSALMLWAAKDKTEWERQRFVRRCADTIAAAGLTAAVMSVVNVAFPIFYPVIYGRRLSLRLDYNLFSTVILMGLIAGSFLLREKPPLHPRVFFLYLITAPAIILSSSRRSFVLLIVFFVWQVVWSILHADKSLRLHLAGGWLAVLLGVVSMSGLMQVYLNHQYERRLQLKEPMVSQSESSALERYEQMGQSGSESKRLLIWSVAAKEQRSYTAAQKMFGKGFGYDRLLYQISEDSRLKEAYPPESRRLLSAHCFVLTDLLNGGYVQAILGLGIWFLIGLRLLKALLQKRRGAMFFCITLGIVFFNNFISNRYGFGYDKYFWLLLTMMTLF